MRVSSSQHTYDVELIENIETANLHPLSGRVLFKNIRTLLLSATRLETEPVSSDVVQQKRKERSQDMSDDVVTRKQPAKRVKLENGDPDDFGSTVVADAIPIFRHRFHIDFSVRAGSVSQNGQNNLRRGRFGTEDLQIVLSNKCDGLTGLAEFDLGEVLLAVNAGQVTANAPKPATQLNRSGGTEHSQLLIVPALFDTSIVGNDHDFRDAKLRDLLVASLTLHSSGRIKAVAYLRLVSLIPPTIQAGSDKLPFTLSLDILVSMLTPQIFQSPATKHSSKDSAVEEAQRRIITFVFGSALPPANYCGKTDMPFFLSSLKPAPLLSTFPAMEAVQPPDLLPSLLPFQRRTVAKLLAREGKAIDASGHIVAMTRSSSDLPLFWEQIEVDGRILYLNRLTGEILPSDPPRDECKGAILAEEPGLGKTLESIALIMLNPSTNRTPRRKIWDSSANAEVSQIKVSDCLKGVIVSLRVLNLDHSDRYTNFIGISVDG